VFNDFPLYNNFKPVFYKGLLCSNGEKNSANKGDVLINFLNVQKYCPKFVVMIDDRKQALVDVEVSLKSFDPKIQFLGINFLGAQKHIHPIDEQNFTAFWKYLIKFVMSSS
jgi:hypothetical protein